MHDPILEVLNLCRTGELRRGGDNPAGLFERDARLLAIGRGAEHLPRGNAFRSKRVKQGQRAAERSLPVAASDLQIHDAAQPAPVVMAWAVHLADDPELPRVPYQGPLLLPAPRMLEELQEVDGTLAVAAGVRNRRAVSQPGGT